MLGDLEVLRKRAREILEAPIPSEDSIDELENSIDELFEDLNSPMHRLDEIADIIQDYGKQVAKAYYEAWGREA